MALSDVSAGRTRVCETSSIYPLSVQKVPQEEIACPCDAAWKKQGCEKPAIEPWNWFDDKLSLRIESRQFLRVVCDLPATLNQFAQPFQFLAVILPAIRRVLFVMIKSSGREIHTLHEYGRIRHRIEPAVRAGLPRQLFRVSAVHTDGFSPWLRFPEPPDGIGTVTNARPGKPDHAFVHLSARPHHGLPQSTTCTTDDGPWRKCTGLGGAGSPHFPTQHTGRHGPQWPRQPVAADLATRNSSRTTSMTDTDPQEEFRRAQLKVRAAGAAHEELPTASAGYAAAGLRL